MAKEALSRIDFDEMQQALEACKACEFLQKRLHFFVVEQNEDPSIDPEE